MPATYRYAGSYRAGADVLLVHAAVAPPASNGGVTTNGQQYVDAPPFGYYDAPVVSAVSPTTGPRDGGTRSRCTAPTSRAAPATSAAGHMT